MIWFIIFFFSITVCFAGMDFTGKHYDKAMMDNQTRLNLIAYIGDVSAAAWQFKAEHKESEYRAEYLWVNMIDHFLLWMKNGYPKFELTLIKEYIINLKNYCNEEPNEVKRRTPTFYRTFIKYLPDIEYAIDDLLEDKAMKTEYKVPYFEKKIDAINYANKVKWNEEILKAFKQAEYEAYYDRYDRQIGWFNDMYTPNRYREYWECLDLAIYIMEKYKEKGEKGEDPAQVGSAFEASSIPWKEEKL